MKKFTTLILLVLFVSVVSSAVTNAQVLQDNNGNSFRQWNNKETIQKVTPTLKEKIISAIKDKELGSAKNLAANKQIGVYTTNKTFLLCVTTNDEVVASITESPCSKESAVVSVSDDFTGNVGKDYKEGRIKVHGTGVVMRTKVGLVKFGFGIKNFWDKITGNYETEDLMDDYNQAEQLASDIMNKTNDTQNSVIQKIG